MAKAKEGWHVVYGHNVYVNEFGLVVRGTTGEGTLHCRPTHPYFREKIAGNYVWNNRNVSLSAFRAAYKRGRACMM